MIFSYNKTSKAISIPKETEIEKHKILERQDLERWVEKYPQILGEELLIITTEYDKFNKTDDRLDLLALDHDGNLVVIELKRTNSGKAVELQAIKYAAYCSTMTLDDVAIEYKKHENIIGNNLSEDEARNKITEFITNEDFEKISSRPRLFLVAKDFQPEVTSTVMWLRTFGVDIVCIKLTPYESGDTLTFESSILIPLPEAKDIIVRTERKENIERGTTVLNEVYSSFFNEISSRTATKIPVHPHKPANYYQIIPMGISNVHLEWIFRGRNHKELNVEFHLEKSDRQENLRILELLKPAVEKLEKRLGMNVNVYPDWGIKWARFGVSRTEESLTTELKEWAVKTMVTFYEVIQPEINKLKEESKI